jgi:hypothetical protein
VRGYEKAGRCSFFNKVNLLLMIKRARPVHLKIMLHYWGKQRAYSWGKCPSSYIVKKCPVISGVKVGIFFGTFKLV